MLPLDDHLKIAGVNWHLLVFYSQMRRVTPGFLFKWRIPSLTQDHDSKMKYSTVGISVHNLFEDRLIFSLCASTLAFTSLAKRVPQVKLISCVSIPSSIWGRNGSILSIFVSRLPAECLAFRC